MCRSHIQVLAIITNDKNNLVDKLTLNKTVLTGILILLCIHSGSLIATSLLENFTKTILDIIGFSWTYGYLPWTKFIVVPLELYLILKYLKKLDTDQSTFDYDKILQLTILTIVLLIGTQFRFELEPSNIVCGNVFFNEDESSQYYLNMKTHSQQQYVADVIEKVVYGFFILFVTLKNFKNPSNKNNV
jgi:hypothetical protein